MNFDFLLQGLTFTAANQVVFAELHWTPGILEQCEDRAHRIGQINSIHVHYLVARGTMDEWIWSALSRKVCIFYSFLYLPVGKLLALQLHYFHKRFPICNCPDVIIVDYTGTL